MRFSDVFGTIECLGQFHPEENNMSSSFKFVAPLVAGIVALTVVLQGASAREDKPKANTGTIKGKVTAEDGKPAAKVNVRLFQPGMRGGRGPATQPVSPQLAQPADDGKDKQPAPQPPPGSPPGHGGGRFTPLKAVVTDADGKFTIDEVAPGDYVVRAGERGHSMARAPVTVKAGETVTVDLQLAPPPNNPPPQ
jgi:hypothetical protein